MTFNRRLACHFLKVTPAKHFLTKIRLTILQFYNVGEIEMIFISKILEFKVSQIFPKTHSFALAWNYLSGEIKL